MKKDIAIICATPRKSNPGMRAVDLAALNIVNSHKRKLFFDFFCFDLPSTVNEDAIEYQSIVNFEASEYRCILIWGDFLLTRHWQNKIINFSTSELFFNLELIENKLLLKNASEATKKKVIIYGQCIFVDDFFELNKDSDYYKAIKDLLSNAKYVRFREPISYFRSKMLLDNRKNDNIDVAFDAAFFNTLEYSKNDIRVNKSGGKVKVGIFLGRTKLSNFQKILIAYEFYKIRKDIELEWIPWLDNLSTSSYRLLKFISNCERNERPKHIHGFYEKLNNFDVILSDTYHCCIVSLSLGLRVYCLGIGSQEFTDNAIADKKKELLFQKMSIMNNYVYAEKLYESSYRSSVFKSIVNDKSNANIELHSKLKKMLIQERESLLQAIDELISNDIT